MRKLFADYFILQTIDIYACGGEEYAHTHSKQLPRHIVYFMQRIEPFNDNEYDDGKQRLRMFIALVQIPFFSRVVR